MSKTTNEGRSTQRAFKVSEVYVIEQFLSDLIRALFKYERTKLNN